MPRRGPASSAAALIGESLQASGVSKPRLAPAAVRPERRVPPRPLAASPVPTPPASLSCVPAEARAASTSSGYHVPTQAHGPGLPQPCRLQLQRWAAAAEPGDGAFPARPEPAIATPPTAARFPARRLLGEHLMGRQGRGAGETFGACKKLVAGCQVVEWSRKRHLVLKSCRPVGRLGVWRGPGPYSAVQDAQVEGSF